METRRIVKGQNIELPSETVRLQIAVGWHDPDGDREIDASALLLDPDRRVASDAAFVFYNQPTSADGAVHLLGRTVTEAEVEERIALDLEALSADVHTVAVTASVDRGTFGDLKGMYLVASDPAGEPVARYDITDVTTESAFVFGEVYRRNGTWKLRAVGQGWDTGLAGLATDFGVCVDDSPAAVETPAEEVVEPAEAPDTEVSDTEASDTEASDTEASDTEADAPADLAPETADGSAVTLAEVIPLPGLATPQPAAAPARRERGVRTRKPRTVAPTPLVAATLAEDPHWQTARLFSVAGIGAADEQEKRATSALLATIQAVRPFGRGIAARCGGPAGMTETFAEVQFPLGERTVIPDGVIRIQRAGRVWTALLEVKTGSSQLRREQVENYLDVARERGYDAVVTLSNEIPPAAGEHPVAVDKRKLRKVAMLHLSWAEVLHEARMVLTHRGVAEAMPAWILAEFIRYLEHPRSGAAAFEDMGAAWVPVREAVAAGTLRASDRKAPAVADAWLRLVRSLCLQLTAYLGVTVVPLQARRIASDPAARRQAVIARLAADGVLEATLRVPGAVGPVSVVADVRVGQVRTAVDVPAPREGSGQRRLAWLLRQLKDEVPGDLVIEASFVGRSETTCERLDAVRAKPAVLLTDRGLEVASFRLSRSSPLGTKRSGVRGAFVPSVLAAVEAFYGTVVQGLRPWASPAPQLPAEAVAEAEAESSAAVDVDGSESRSAG